MQPITQDLGAEFGIRWLDVVWLSFATVLVLMMSPANAFFYAGTVEFKNALSVIFICMLTMAVAGIQWFLWGYSLAFSATSNNPVIGNGSSVLLLNNVGFEPHPNCPTVPAMSFMLYQLMFCILTPALAFGAIVERTRIIPWVIFLFVWLTVVYDFTTYWTWAPNGWLKKWGTLDFAGGIAVHVVSGFAGLAASLFVGPRRYATSTPHNLTYTLLGTALFWFGWTGFNAGSECAIDGRALKAMISTQLAACFGGVTWIIYDYRLHQKTTSLGFCSGVISGLVCITPASGYVQPYFAPLFGILGTLAANNACFLKSKLRFDDSLDSFPVHGIAGMAGSLLTAIFAEKDVELSGWEMYDAKGGWLNGNFYVMVPQLVGCLAVAAWSFFITALIIWSMDKIKIPWFGGKKISLSLQMNADDELAGTDFALLGEVACTCFLTLFLAIIQLCR